MNAMLEIADLASGYGRTEVLRGVSLRVSPGEIVALLGSNGAGKTTLNHTVCGLVPATRGTVRFDGVELANAFGELTDPLEQRARFEDDLAMRRARSLPQYPIDEKLLSALAEGLPPSAGIALGVDRLAMLVLGAGTIGDVLAFANREL